MSKDYIKYFNIIKEWLLTHEIKDGDYFSLLTTKQIPYGVCISNINKLSRKGKPTYSVLQGSTIPIINKCNSISKMIENGTIEKHTYDTYIYKRDGEFISIRGTRVLVGTTDGRWPLELFCANNIDKNTEYTFTVDISKYNKEFIIDDTHNIKIRIVQGIFIVDNNYAFLTYEEAFEYILSKYNLKIKQLSILSKKSCKDELNNKVQEAEHSITSDTSSEAESLSEKALQQVSDIVDNKLNEKNNNLVYDYIESKPYINKKLQFNYIKLKRAIDILNESNTLYITGKSGSGKTFLTKEIAGKLCNIDLTDVNSNNEDFECYSNCLWVETERIDTKEFRNQLAKFCMHNKNSENCLIVFNEASKPAFSRIFPFWERMDDGGVLFKERLQQGLVFKYNDCEIELPKSLKIIALIADEQYDPQMERRFKTRLNINEFSKEEYEEISTYTEIKREIIDILFEFQVVRCEQAVNEEHRLQRTFIIPYELKKNKINELESYLNNHLKAVGIQWEEKRGIVKNYIEELKKNEIQQ